MDKLRFRAQYPVLKSLFPGQFSLVITLPVVLRGVIADGEARPLGVVVLDIAFDDLNEAFSALAQLQFEVNVEFFLDPAVQSFVDGVVRGLSGPGHGTYDIRVFNEFIVGKYISIEMLIEKSKDSYYEALQASSQDWHEDGNNYLPFLKYMLGVVVKAYNEFENRVEHLRYRKISKPERIKAIIERTPGKITKKEISQTCPDISLTTIERTLSDLLAAGYIEKTGTGRATAYVKK